MFARNVFRNSLACVAILALAEAPLLAADWIYIFKQDVKNGDYVIETIRAVDPATGNVQVISGFESARDTSFFYTNYFRYRNASGPTYFFNWDGSDLVIDSVADGSSAVVEEFRGVLDRRTDVEYVAPDKFFVGGYIVDIANDTVTGSYCDSCFLEPGTTNTLALSGRTVARITEAGVSTDLFTIPPLVPAGATEMGLKFVPIGDGKAIMSWEFYTGPLFSWYFTALVSYTDVGYTEIGRDQNNLGRFAYYGSGEIGFVNGGYHGGTLTRMNASNFTKIGAQTIPGFQTFSKFPGGFVTYSTPTTEQIDPTHRRETMIATIYESDQTVTDQPMEVIVSTPLNPLRRGNGPQFPSGSSTKKILVSPAGDKLYMGGLGSVMTIDVATGDRTLANVSGLDLRGETAVGPAVNLSSRDIPTLSDMTNHLTGEQALPESKLPNADMNADYRIDTGDLQITADQ